MICIRCGKDSKYKERKDRHCPHCKREFAFEPQKGDRITDAGFKAAINRVSAKGTVRWGVEHLYYQVARILMRKPTLAFAVGCLAVGVVTVFVVGGAVAGAVPVVFIAVIAVGLVLIARLLRRPKRYVTVSTAEFDRLWRRWCAVHGTPAGVIERHPDARPALADAEPDVADYSFDRAVICDRARTVDLLLANNFHFENNCAVVSLGGYPQAVFPTVLRMLKRNPRLEVFTLHDATLEGCTAATRIARDREWFGGLPIRIVDVGLRPRHAAPFAGVLLARNVRVGPQPGLEPDELAWLSTHALELAAIAPEQVLKRLFRAMNQSRLASTTASGGGGDSGGGGSGTDTAFATTNPSWGVDLGDEGKFGGGASGGGGAGVSFDTDSFSSDAGADGGDGDGFG